MQRGDTIGSLLARAGVDDAAAMQFLRVDPNARPLYQLRPGRPVHVAVDAEGDLQALKFRTTSGDMLAIDRQPQGFRATRAQVTEEVRTVLRSGEIRYVALRCRGRRRHSRPDHIGTRRGVCGRHRFPSRPAPR